MIFDLDDRVLLSVSKGKVLLTVYVDTDIYISEPSMALVPEGQYWVFVQQIGSCVTVCSPERLDCHEYHMS